MSDKRIFPAPTLFESLTAHVNRNFTLPVAGLDTSGGVRTYTAPVSGFDPVVPIVYDGNATADSNSILGRNEGRVQARGMIWTEGLVFSTNTDKVRVTDGSINILADNKNLVLNSKDFSSSSEKTTITATGDTQDSIILSATGATSNVSLSATNFVKVQNLTVSATEIATNSSTETLKLTTATDSYLTQSSTETTITNANITVIASGTANIVSQSSSVNIAANGTTSDLNLYAKRTTKITSETGSLEVYSARDANITVGVTGSSGLYYNSNISLWASGSGTTGGSINLYSGPQDQSSYFRQNNTVTTIKNDYVNINGNVSINNYEVFSPSYLDMFNSISTPKSIFQEDIFLNNYFQIIDRSNGITMVNGNVSAPFFDSNFYVSATTINFTPNHKSPIIKALRYIDSQVKSDYIHNIQSPGAAYETYKKRYQEKLFPPYTLPFVNTSILKNGISHVTLKVIPGISSETHKLLYSNGAVNVSIIQSAEYGNIDGVTIPNVEVSSLYFKDPGVYSLHIKGSLTLGVGNSWDLLSKAGLVKTTSEIPDIVNIPGTISVNDYDFSLNSVSSPFAAYIEPVIPLQYNNTTEIQSKDKIFGASIYEQKSSTIPFNYINLDFRFTDSNNVSSNTIEQKYLTGYSFKFISSGISYTPISNQSLNFEVSESFVRLVETDLNRDTFFFQPSRLQSSRVPSNEDTFIRSFRLSEADNPTNINLDIKFFFKLDSPGYLTMHPSLYRANFSSLLGVSYEQSFESLQVSSFSGYEIFINRIG